MCKSGDEITIEVDCFIQSQHDRVISPATHAITFLTAIFQVNLGLTLAPLRISK